MPRHAEGAGASDAVDDRPVEALLDTSIAVALMVADHADHAHVIEVTRGMRLGLAGHAWFETYSVLTRMPAGLRRSPADIRRLLAHDFHGSWFLDVAAAVALTDELARLRIAGGAVYDALVGAAARHHDLPLLTSDRRALRTYDALGVRIRLVGD
ncbi:MAG: type II toxin-antitoxin system VapC family toxin [Chloroflexi bacterium]|nr:type II toxin-antitoxin system VapC family toxin [Chloroflexota bacterium]